MNSGKQQREKRQGKGGIGHVLANNLFMIKIAFKEAPFYTLVMMIDMVIAQIVNFLEHIYLIGFLVNAITLKKPFTDVLVFMGVIFLVILVFNIFRGSFRENLLTPVNEQKLNRCINMALFKKASEMDLKCYDDPEFYNGFVWAMNEAPGRLNGMLVTMSNFFGSITFLAIAGGMVISHDAVGLTVILTSFLGILILGNVRNKLNLEMNEEQKPHERKRDYLSRVLYLADYAKEIRTNRIKKKLYADFADAVRDMEHVAKRRTFPLAIVDFVSRFVFELLLIDGVYLFYLLYRSIEIRDITYGTLVMLYNSCNWIRNYLFQLSRIIPEFQEHSLYIDKIRTFLDYENTILSPDKPQALPPAVESFEFRNVSFQYGEKTAITNVNMTIRKGQKIAIVGYNGAGKTTFVKLLMRLYDVSGGQILYNGKDIRCFALKEYRSIFETVFQDFQLFAASVGENITTGLEPLDAVRAERAVRQAGFKNKLAELKKGYDSQVTREFDDDGIQFSGGEAQSLAISRALYKDSPVIILDEPSSALDPLAEYKLNQTMFELGTDKTVITISHRLSTTKSADCIYMFEAGRIVEQGTHDQLMEKKGRYFEMFSLQAEKYNITIKEEIV